MKSKRNCEGYTPRVIFKDPLNAFRPAVGPLLDTPPPFHQFSNRDPATGQFTQLQSISASQVPLPVIAPRPSAPDDFFGPNSTASIAGYGISGESYNSYNYPYDTRQYIANELHPHMQQSFQPRAASQDEQDTYIPDQSVANSLGSYSYSDFPKLGAGESDSGIDMSHSGLLSQSSTPSNPSLVVFSGHGRYGASPTNSTVSRPRVSDASPQTEYPNPSSVFSKDLWPNPAPGGYHDSWSSTICPQPVDARSPPGEVTAIAINNQLRTPVFEGNGKYRLLPFWG